MHVENVGVRTRDRTSPAIAVFSLAAPAATRRIFVCETLTPQLFGPVPVGCGPPIPEARFHLRVAGVCTPGDRPAIDGTPATQRAGRVRAMGGLPSPALLRRGAGGLLHLPVLPHETPILVLPQGRSGLLAMRRIEAPRPQDASRAQPDRQRRIPLVGLRVSERQTADHRHLRTMILRVAADPRVRLGRAGKRSSPCLPVRVGPIGTNNDGR